MSRAVLTALAVLAALELSALRAPLLTGYTRAEHVLVRVIEGAR